MLQKLLLIIITLGFLLGGYIAFMAVNLPNVHQALETGVQPTQTSQILARDGSVLMSYGKYQHKPVPLSDVSPAMINALLATEDRRFYQHHGIDPVGIGRAMVRDVISHGASEGGSTITQQLARNIFLSNERSFQRKLKEILLAFKLEQQLSKNQILEMYLNNVYFGEGAYGIGAASNIYFGKTPKRLTVAEAALLAGLPQAPSRYSPFANPERALKRRAEVLDNLVATGKLTQTQADGLKDVPMHLNPAGQSLTAADRAAFFNRYVIQEVLKMLDMDEQTFWQQGLKVYTTLDPRAQSIAENQVLNLSNAYGRRGAQQQAALLSMNTQGQIIAYVGGKSFSVSQFDRISQSRRPAGSLFKAFVYTTAIEHGYSPLTVYRDEPVSYGPYTPSNYDKHHHGYMTLARALAQSNNVIAVKLVHDLTPDAVIQTAQRLGIRSPMEPNLSLALGAVDVSLLEMTGAFNVFAANGTYTAPYAIEKIVDRAGQILYQSSPTPQPVIQRMPRDTMVELMEGVVKFGTARGAQLSRPVAGKTGTSDDYRDAWFIGYTPEITTGVWVGNDNNAQMPGITGGSLPARIWQGYMSRLTAGTPKSDFDLTAGQPVEDKDFFVYNLQNLSASEGKASANAGDENTSEGSNNAPPADQPNNTGNTDPEAAPNGVPAGIPPADAGSNPEPTRTINDGPGTGNQSDENAPPPAQAPREDRFFDFTPKPRSAPRQRVPNTSRPIEDPVQ